MKTLTVRVDDDTYILLKKAADGEKRTVSNFIEYAALRYLSSELFVSDEEMEEISQDKELVQSLKRGVKEAKQGKYKIVS
jgi:uncharacterized protein (DUF1778 family)